MIKDRPKPSCFKVCWVAAIWGLIVWGAKYPDTLHCCEHKNTAACPGHRLTTDGLPFEWTMLLVSYMK